MEALHRKARKEPIMANTNKTGNRYTYSNFADDPDNPDNPDNPTPPGGGIGIDPSFDHTITIIVD